MNDGYIKSYLIGASHDGTYSSRHGTYRFCQKEKEWIIIIKELLEKINCKAWIYKEGKNRGLYIVETSAKFLTDMDISFINENAKNTIAYARGYFDAEGGVPSNIQSRFYVQYCQKNYNELSELKEMLSSLGISAGLIHNPSKKVDPNYFRFFVSSKSLLQFIEKIGSWHPRKKQILEDRYNKYKNMLSCN